MSASSYSRCAERQSGEEGEGGGILARRDKSCPGAQEKTDWMRRGCMLGPRLVELLNFTCRAPMACLTDWPEMTASKFCNQGLGGNAATKKGASNSTAAALIANQFNKASACHSVFFTCRDSFGPYYLERSDEASNPGGHVANAFDAIPFLRSVLQVLWPYLSDDASARHKTKPHGGGRGVITHC